MPDFPVSQDDIERLGEKLANFASELSESERALLLGILSTAADRMGQVAKPVISRVSRQDTPIVVTVPDDFPSIRDEFLKAFTPGARGRNGLADVSINVAP
jgi:hypothetical protein